MINLAFVIYYLMMSVAISIHCKNITLGSIQDINIYTKLYPKWYSHPGPKIKKFYHLKVKAIPSFLHFELYFALIQFSFGPLFTIIYLLTKNDGIAEILILGQCLIALVNIIFVLVLSTVFERNK